MSRVLSRKNTIGCRIKFVYLFKKINQLFLKKSQNIYRAKSVTQFKLKLWYGIILKIKSKKFNKNLIKL